MNIISMSQTCLVRITFLTKKLLDFLQQPVASLPSYTQRLSSMFMELKVIQLANDCIFRQELMSRYAKRSVRLAYPSSIESHFKNAPYMVLSYLC